MYRCGAFVGAATCLLLCVAATTAAEKQDNPLPGTWTVVSVERDGKPRADFDKFKGEKWTITADHLKAVGPQGGGEFPYKVDLTQKPNTIDLTVPFVRGPVLGIFEVKGDTLTLCFGEARPKEFSSKDGAELIVLKRAK
jgi:uncharacterized protein (TIGR03067 family)